MNSIFDTDEPPLSREDLKEAIEKSTARLRLWRNRSLCSIIALLLSCACVYPFVDGRTLSGPEELVKRGLLLLSLGFLVGALYTTLLWWGAWRILRDLELGRM
jgi:hypothetical protein